MIDTLPNMNAGSIQSIISENQIKKTILNKNKPKSKLKYNRKV